MLTLLAFLFLFLIITLVHELGHLLLARRAGIRVYEFSFGLGPKVFSIKPAKTEYSLRLIPLGGFVRLAGLEIDPEDKTCPAEEKYNSKSVGQKFLSLAAGPAMNLLLAVVIFFLVFTFYGAPSGLSNQIAAVTPGSRAEAIGLQPGDLLLMIDRQKVEKMEEAIALIHKSSGKKLLLTLQRRDKTFSVKAIPQYNEKLKLGLIGFSPKILYTRYHPLQALAISLLQTLGMAGLILYFLGKLILGGISFSEIAGPVGIAQISGQYASQGFLAFIQFTAFFSINVAVLNLLPLPALDGGRLFFVILEALRGKPLNIEKENKVHYVGLIILLALAAVITVNDLVRLFPR